MRFNGFHPCGRRFQRRTHETARHGRPGPSCRRSRVHGVLRRIEPLRRDRFPPNGLLGSSRLPHSGRWLRPDFRRTRHACVTAPYDGNGTGGTCNEEIASLIPPIEKRNRTWIQAETAPVSENVGYPHPRRVIHTYPHRNAIRHIARHYATQHGAAQQKRKTRRSGPSCKNLRSRIAAQQHRRNGKSIQCPFNVTTYLGHTHLVGLCSSVVLVLRNYARHCGKCKPKQDDVPYLSQLLLSDRKNRKNAPCCANRNACLFIHVHFPRKNGVSEAYFTNSANEC